MERDEICRTCLCTSSKFIPIDSKTSYLGQTFTITRMIMACAPVEISTGDGLPSQVCEICLKLLYVSFIFRIRIMQANEKLKHFLRTKLVPDLQPVSEGFIEPLVMPMPSLLEDLNIKQIFSLLHSTSTGTETDPLTADPFNLANFSEQTEIKTEIKTEILPIEEVLLPTHDNTLDNTANLEANFVLSETAESVNINIPTPVVTSASEIVKSTFPENIPNTNLFDQSQAMPYQINIENVDNMFTNTLTDTEMTNLTETDTNLIQSVIQSIQNTQKDKMKNTKYIIINANQINHLLTTDSIAPTQPDQNKHQLNSHQNLSFNKEDSVQNSASVKNILPKQTCTENKNLPSTSQNTSYSNNVNMSNNIIPNKPFLKKPENHNFEGELLKFVQAREKYLETRQDAFAPVTKSYTRKKKIDDVFSIDLTSDDSIPDVPVPAKTIHLNENTKKYSNYKLTKPPGRNVNSNKKIGYIRYKPLLPTDLEKSEVSASTFFTQMSESNGSSKVVRLVVEEDESSSIIIDD